MPYSIEWLIPRQVIFTQIWDNTFQDLDELDHALLKFLGESDATLVHIVVAIKNVTQPPTLKDIKIFQHLQHPHLGWYITIGVENALIKMFGSVMLQMFKVRNRFMLSPEEALTFLQQVDSTLPDLQTAWADYQTRQRLNFP